jgi:hypothetical protein
VADTPNLSAPDTPADLSAPDSSALSAAFDADREAADLQAAFDADRQAAELQDKEERSPGLGQGIRLSEQVRGSVVLPAHEQIQQDRLGLGILV